MEKIKFEDGKIDKDDNYLFCDIENEKENISNKEPTIKYKKYNPIFQELFLINFRTIGNISLKEVYKEIKNEYSIFLYEEPEDFIIIKKNIKLEDLIIKKGGINKNKDFNRDFNFVIKNMLVAVNPIFPMSMIFNMSTNKTTRHIKNIFYVLCKLGYLNIELNYVFKKSSTVAYPTEKFFNLIKKYIKNFDCLIIENDGVFIELKKRNLIPKLKNAIPKNKQILKKNLSKIQNRIFKDKLNYNILDIKINDNYMIEFLRDDKLNARFDLEKENIEIENYIIPTLDYIESKTNDIGWSDMNYLDFSEYRDYICYVDNEVFKALFNKSTTIYNPFKQYEILKRENKMMEDHTISISPIAISEMTNDRMAINKYLLEKNKTNNRYVKKIEKHINPKLYTPIESNKIKKVYSDSSLFKGGRRYSKYTTIPSIYRNSKYMRFDDKEIVEIDITSEFPNFLHKIQFGSFIKDRDIYTISNDDIKYIKNKFKIEDIKNETIRLIIKLIINIGINAMSKNETLLAIKYKISSYCDRSTINGLYNTRKNIDYKYKKILTSKPFLDFMFDCALKNEYWLNEYMYKDLGIDLMYIESLLSDQVIKKFLDKTNDLIISYHDSYIVKKDYKHILEKCLYESFDKLFNDNLKFK